MKSVKFSLLLMLAAMLTFTSCTSRLVDFTIISSKSHNLKIDKSLGVRVSGSSNGFLGLGASIKDAMDKALQSAGADYDLLIDGVVRVNDYLFVSGYKVEGTAISSNKMKASLGAKGFEDWCKANNVFAPSTSAVQN
jgi:hypothetical protein